MPSDASFSRFVLDGDVQHRGGQQFVRGRGMSGEILPRVHRIEPHGFASSPVAGGIATAIQARGSRDSVYAFGGENPSLRPELPAGGTALYDHMGNVIKLIGGGGAVLDFGNRTATLTAGTWTINGALTMEVGGAGATIKGNLRIEGNVQVVGSLSATGTVTDGDGDGGA